MVWSAGVYCNAFLGSITSIALSYTHFSPSIRSVLLMVMVANYIAAIFNLIPFVPSDGYFIFCTAFRQVNLRVRAWREFRNWISLKKSNFTGLLATYVLASIVMLMLFIWRDAVWIMGLRHATVRGAVLRVLLLLFGCMLLVVRLLDDRDAQKRSGS